MGIIWKQIFCLPSFNKKKAMKIQATLCTLVVLASIASATVIEVTVSSAVAGAAAYVLGAKVLALKGVLIGRALGKIFLDASRKDQYDCAKSLICELSAKPIQELK